MPMRFTETAVLVVMLASITLAVTRVRAQDRDPAAAQALFDDGQRLMNDKRYAEACSKLAESLRLDPGIGTQFHLASCHEHEGKLASAWAAFHEVASLAAATGQDARAKAAKRRASLLEPRLPRLAIVVPAAAQAPGLEITRDGVVVGQAQWGVAVPVDPGPHAIEATAPGRRAFAGSVTASESATASFEVPPLEAAAGEGSPAPVTPESGPPPQAAPQPATSVQTEPAAASTPASSGPSALVIGLGIGGIAVTGAGAVLGLVASSKNDESKKHCDPDDPSSCSDRGVTLRDDAFLFGNLATVAFIVGGAAIATAGILWIADDPREPSERATLSIGVTPSAAAMAVSGRF